MEKRELVGIGTVVMRNKQYLAAIRPLDGVLAMSTMRFADEIVPRAEIDALPRRAKPDAANLRIATQLLDAMSSSWDPRRYHDTFTEDLRDRIEAKDKGKDIVEEAEPAATPANVVDLMSALEQSVKQAKGGRSRAKRGRTQIGRGGMTVSCGAGQGRRASMTSAGRGPPLDSDAGRRLVIEVPGRAPAIARARRAVADFLARRGVPSVVVDDMELVTSELVTNAIIHPPTPVDVVRVEVGATDTVSVAVSHVGVADGDPTGRELASTACHMHCPDAGSPSSSACPMPCRCARSVTWRSSRAGDAFPTVALVRAATRRRR